MSRRILLAAVVLGGVLAALVAFLPRRPAALTCAEGTAPVAVSLPGGRQAWCERADPMGARRRQGAYAAWYLDGRPKVTGAYQDGAPDGWWEFWTPEGRRREEGRYRTGQEEGLWKRWHGNGQPREAGEYHAGVRHGRWTFWFVNGRREREGEYREGVPVGPWDRWNLRGDPCPRPAGSA